MSRMCIRFYMAYIKYSREVSNDSLSRTPVLIKWNEIFTNV